MPLVKKPSAPVMEPVAHSIPSTAAAPVSNAAGAKQLAQDVVAAGPILDGPMKFTRVPLSNADKDVRILTQGIVQAVIQSDIYGHQCSLMDEKEIDTYLAGKVQFWMDKVRELSGTK